MTIKITKQRGRGHILAVGSWHDSGDCTCYIFESLGYDGCLGLGRAYEHMELTREMVAELLPLLQHFVDTGKLPPEFNKVDRLAVMR